MSSIVAQEIGIPCTPGLRGKRAIVTGGTQGIGKAVAQRLLASGADVIITGRDERRGNEVRQELSELGSVHYIQQDVASEDGWHRVMSAAAEVLGGLDVLVNNAAASVSQTIAQSSVAEFNAVLQTNLTSVFMGIKFGAELMMQSGGGAIVNLSSVAAGKAHSNLQAYSASKAGLEALTRGAVLEFSENKQNIRINAVRPGYIETDLSVDFLTDIGGSVEGGLAIMVSQHPIGTIGQPMDVAAMIAFLSSDDARFITGGIFSVDGGYQIR
ncbi:SDR family NAD(P)-dependent oxidoreductase [Sphingobium chungbukense]|uniref:Short-chain dehydrogenase n=1 Tax=Sphingobium chungbukense TaxID=56193 RepID=A0A0M3AMG2_9SPHN|nr:SDR family oxidoreductase [Sphingobium chungbukense]KKW90126.1 hypothetical protein YP76_22060 [Sphingobium chungbukense]